MPTTVILDEVHLTFRIPTDLPNVEVNALRRVLESDEFLVRLRRAIRTVLAAFPELASTRVRVDR